MVRIVGVTALPWILVVGGSFVYLPLLYWLAPVFLPTFSYQRSLEGNGSSILAEWPVGYLVGLFYTLICAIAIVLLSKGHRLGATIGISAGVVALAALVAHVTLHFVFGYEFFMLTP